jgi:signal transduction histidine kinase
MRWPWRALSANTEQQIESTVAILVMGMLIVGLIAAAFAAYLTRPLLQLADVAKRIARGEHGQGEDLPAEHLRRGDEVGALFGAIHHMESEVAIRDQKIREDLETISRLNASLEERVRERTLELEKAQARLVDVERFAAMGKTAAAIAHEMRNALNGLGMCVDLVLADTASSTSAKRVRTQIHHEIARLRDVTESLLTFARAPRLECTPTDVDGLIGRALDVLSEEIAEGGVSVVRERDGDRPLVFRCDGYKLQGVVINLVKNAVEAMTTRPLDLSAAAPPLGDAAAHERRLTLRLHEHAPDAATGNGPREVQLEVEDTGPGLLPDARTHLFEPFYTTKVTGTGLGLSTSRRIVEAHGGTIEVGDAPGGGACVRVRIPDRDAATETARAAG